MEDEKVSLAERRREAGMTQTDLAKACGLTVSAIKAYENGRRRPSMKAITALYRALGLDAFEIASLYMEVDNDGA